MKTIKIVYFIVALCYFITIALYFSSYEISYRIVGVKPELVKERSLTNEEHKGLERAQKIRNAITTTLLWFSLFISVVSGLIWYFKLFDPTIYLKAIFFIAIFWTLLLVLARGIHFMPTVPIR